MSGTVDLMVVGMAQELSAEELSLRLVKEFNQPADAFDALVSAATGAGSAYAAQSDVEPDVALEGKARLEALGLICAIPGVTDQQSANDDLLTDTDVDHEGGVDADVDAIDADIAEDFAADVADPAIQEVSLRLQVRLATTKTLLIFPTNWKRWIPQ